MRMGHVEPEWQETEQKRNRDEAKSGKSLSKAAAEEPAGIQASLGHAEEDSLWTYLYDMDLYSMQESVLAVYC